MKLHGGTLTSSQSCSFGLTFILWRLVTWTNEIIDVACCYVHVKLFIFVGYKTNCKSHKITL